MIFVLTACATPISLNKQTSSEYPKGVFANTTVEVVKSRIMDGCSSKGIMIKDVQSNSVICGKKMSGNDAFLATLAMGNSYSTTPEKKVRFMIFQNGSNVKVTEQQWMELQMAFDQMKKQELNSNNQRNDMQIF